MTASEDSQEALRLSGSITIEVRTLGEYPVTAFFEINFDFSEFEVVQEEEPEVRPTAEEIEA